MKTPFGKNAWMQFDEAAQKETEVEIFVAREHQAMDRFFAFSKQKAQLKNSLIYRGGAEVNPTRYEERLTPARYITGNYFYGGPWFHHFGHFLAESIHRVPEYLEQRSSFDGILFINAPIPGKYSIDPMSIQFARDVIFDYCQLHEDEVTIVGSDATVDRLTLSRPRYELNSPMKGSYANYLSKKIMQFAEAHCKIGSAPHEKVFVSRHNFLLSGRALGMAAIETVYANNGYLIFRPEEHSFKNQVATIFGASTVVFEQGSALHILEIFGRQPKDIVFWSRRGRNSRFFRKNYSDRFRSVQIFDGIIPMTDVASIHPGIAPAFLVPEEVLSFLSRCNLKYDAKTLVEEIKAATYSDLKRFFQQTGTA